MTALATHGLVIEAKGVPATVDAARAVAGKLIGSRPLPDALVSQLEQRFNEMLRSELDANGNNIVVDSITIADGKMTVQAHTQ